MCRKGQPWEEGTGSHGGREEGMGLACLCMPVLRAGRGWVLSAKGGLWTLTGTGLRVVTGGRSTRPHCGGGRGPHGRGVEKGGAGAVTRQDPGWGTGSPALQTVVMPRRAQSSELTHHRHLHGQSVSPQPRNTAITCQS